MAGGYGADLREEDRRFRIPGRESVMGLISLKTRMTMIVSLLMGGMLTLLALLGFRYFENQFRETVEKHQFAIVAAVAEEIDSKLLAAQNQLLAVARGLTAEMLVDGKKAEKYLSGQGAALQTFDNGLFVFSSAGKLMTGTGVESHMKGKDYSFREYYQVTAQSGRPYISKPFFSTQGHAHPIIMLTAPIFGEDRGMTAMLVGSLDLLGENFLARIVDHRIGERGYLYLFNTDRTIILHPERERILRNDVPAGADELFDRAVEGFEGSGETVNSRGLHSLSSFKRLRSTDWILGANFPQAEAYAPIIDARRYFMIGLAATLTLAILTVWFLMRRLTLPLQQITEQAREIAEGRMVTDPLSITRRDEIGVLAGAFNRMLAEIEQQRRAVGEQKEFAENLIRHSAAPAFVIDHRHRVLFWNSACEELTGVKADEIKGTCNHWRAFYDHQRPCLADLVVNGMQEALPHQYETHARAPLVEEGLQAEGWRTMPDGRQRYLIFSAAPIRNRQGAIVAAIQTLEDLTERKEAEKRLEQLAKFDSLTGLPNRVLFFDRLEQGVASASRYNHVLALLYIDLDGFKEINDSLGHDTGDRVLVEVAKRLKGCIRGSDTAARVGGDEFTVILTRVAGEKETAMIAERILDALTIPLLLGKGVLAVGASIGISLFPENGGDADALMKNSDTAMYQAKAEGKSRFRLFSDAGGSDADSSQPLIPAGRRERRP
jgi:diguanylate cyclase (GGDEF)-like protein/PAS domain S-box-containing protein